MSLLHSIVGTIINTASAQDFSQFCSFIDPSCGSGSSGTFLVQVAQRVGGGIVEPLVGGAAVLVIIYGAIRLASSGGDEAGKEAAKRIIKTGLIGLALATIVWPIINFTYTFIDNLTP